MNNKKQALLTALGDFVKQSPGLDPRNYGDRKSYKAESCQVAGDRRHAIELLSAVAMCDGITAEMILEADPGGRLTFLCVVTDTPNGNSYKTDIGDYATVHCDYTTGQYFATEYRKAACRLLSAVLWAYAREHEMPEHWQRVTWSNKSRSKVMRRGEVAAYVASHERRDGRGEMHSIEHLYEDVSAGDWLRIHFLRQFGRTLANRYFS